MVRDLRFALRALVKSPAFTAVAIVTLAIGIGANTAIFSLIERVFLTGLSFARPAELMRIYGDAPERNLQRVPLSIPKFEYFRDHQTAFLGLAADSFNAFTLTGDGDPVQVNGFRATSNYFDVLGVVPIKGRLFLPGEEVAGRVAIVSERFWTRRLSRDPNVVGWTITLDGLSHEIVGVIPDQPMAYFGDAGTLWTTRPFDFPGITPELRERGFSFLRVIGRLAPGVSSKQATVALASLADGYHKAHPGRGDSTWKTKLVGVEDDALGRFREPLWMLFGAVAFVLLIAASNVANLLLVRFSARRREIAMRLALGAERGRVIRLFLAESVMVSMAAAVAGIALAQAALRWLPSVGAGLPLPEGETILLNRTVLIFTVGVAILTGLAMGLYPAFQAARRDVIDALREGGRTSSPSRGQHRFRMTLLGGQVALSFVLLTGASLLSTSFLNLHRQETGFTPDGVLVAPLNLPESRYGTPAQQALFRDHLLSTLRRSPGISHAAIGVGVPLTGYGIQGPYSRADQVIPYTQRPLCPMRFVSSDYLATLGVRLMAGREFTEDDRAGSPMVILISQSGARKLFPENDALGRHLLIGSLDNGQDAEIVGIAADVRSQTLAETPEVEIYRPLTQRPGNSGMLQLVVRAEGADPTLVAPVIRKVVGALDPWLPVAEPESMVEVVGGSLANQRLLMTLLGSFAAIALALAVVGLYSVVAFLVSQRTMEIGVRLALGAEPGAVRRLVLRQGMTPVAIGLLVGAGGALWVGHVLKSRLFGTAPFDPASFGLTAACLVIAALIACALPAHRAARIAPSTALRN